ncbi:MAG TPA: hypothetical protein VGC78_10440 [Gaiellaceae bacterium]
MFRQNWREFGFWRWWWRTRVSTSAKHITGLALAALLLVGGYFASGWLTGASAASDGLNTYVVQTTVTKIVTVKEHGRTIVKRIPVVVRRTVVKARTATATVVDTRVVTTPGGTKYVVRKVTHYVPVVKKHVVRVNGKTTTVTETRLVPTVKTQTQVVTNQQTVTNQSTVVVNHTDTVVQNVTNVVTNTTTDTITLPPQTITLPPLTVTDTVVQTVTLPVTVTDTVTVTT